MIVHVGGDRKQKVTESYSILNPKHAQDPKWLFAWEQADKEATRSMYSFRKHYNYYDQQEAGQDWAGTKSEFFNAGLVALLLSCVSCCTCSPPR